MLIPPADARNEELAPAYSLAPEHALAQYATTGCLNSTFHASDAHQLATLLDLANRVSLVCNSAGCAAQPASPVRVPRWVRPVAFGFDSR